MSRFTFNVQCFQAPNSEIKTVVRNASLSQHSPNVIMEAGLKGYSDVTASND